MKFSHLSQALFYGFVFLLMSCGEDEPPVAPPASKTVIEVLEATGEHTVMVAILKETNLDAVLLREDKSYTIFAPTDEAFAPRDANEVLNFFSINYLNRLIRYHIFESNVSPGRLEQLQTPETLLGQTITVQRANNQWLANNVVFSTENNLSASNATIYPITSIIELPDFSPILEPQYVGDILREEEEFAKLDQFTGLTELRTVLRDSTQRFTVFAFTNESLANFVQAKGFPTADSLPYYVQVNFAPYHVVPDAVLSLEDLRNTNELATLFGKPIEIFTEGEAVFLKSPTSNETVSVIGEPTELRNGIVYTLEKPLDVPVTAKNLLESFEFSWMKEILEDTPLWEDLDDLNQTFSIIAPDDNQIRASFGTTSLAESMGEPQAEELAKYHIIRGSSQINSGREWQVFPSLAKVSENVEETLSILLTTNGLVNGGIRQVSVERYKQYYIANGSYSQSQILNPLRVDQVVSFHPALETLEETVTDNGLGNTIANFNNNTLLAPSNEGFQSTISSVTNGLDSLKQFSSALLQYHTLSGMRAPNSFETGTQLNTQSVGNPLRVSTTDGIIFFGERSTARVVGNPFFARNGIVYVLDNVLLP